MTQLAHTLEGARLSDYYSITIMARPLLDNWHRVSLASQPYFSSCACALGRGAGERNEKIRLVTYARFSFPIGMQLSFQKIV